LLTRYSNIDFVLRLSFCEGLSLLIKALEEYKKEKAWQVWLAKYQHMDKESYVPFEDFYKKTKVPEVIYRRPAADILAEADEIRKKLGKV